MAEFRDDHFEGMFEVFILNAFKEGPRSVFDIQARVKGIERLLEVAAARKGWRGVASLPVTLESLLRQGLLKLEMSGLQEVYFLTETGVERIEYERKRQNSIVSQFIEESELDRSFRQFLNTKPPLGSN